MRYSRSLSRLVEQGGGAMIRRGILQKADSILYIDSPVQYCTYVRMIMISRQFLAAFLTVLTVCLLARTSFGYGIS